MPFLFSSQNERGWEREKSLKSLTTPFEIIVLSMTPCAYSPSHRLHITAIHMYRVSERTRACLCLHYFSLCTWFCRQHCHWLLGMHVDKWPMLKVQVVRSVLIRVNGVLISWKMIWNTVERVPLSAVCECCQRRCLRHVTQWSSHFDRTRETSVKQKCDFVITWLWHCLLSVVLLLLNCMHELAWVLLLYWHCACAWARDLLLTALQSNSHAIRSTNMCCA